MLKQEAYFNCYFLKDKDECYIIDPGCDKEKIKEYVIDKRLKVDGILLTHGHIENIRALDVFKVPIYVHRKEYEILVDTFNQNIENLDFDIDKLKIILIRDKTTFCVNENRIYSLHTPGHTVGSMCYKFRDDIYTGDTLYKGRVGRWDFPTGNLASMRKSIINIIDNTPDYVRIHPAIGESTTIQNEKENNYFYNEWKNMNINQ